MKKAVVLASVAMAAMMFTAGPAAAISEYPPPRVQPAPQDGVANGKNGPSPLAGYLLVSTFCAAGSLIVQSAYVGNNQNRELTSKEAFTTTGNCFVPFIGGPLLWALANGGAPN
ncbi:MAG: hypothetical protein JWN71_2626 [Xanthobacteraceae bacterium]|jgi:hypothetical protein|nr:hypothetical protein [Xanthobacteraceae bacterium]